MTILGITITHDGTLCVVKDGKLVFSIGEERLNRVKCYIGFPFKALEYVVEKKIIDPKHIDLVAVSSGVFKKEWARSYAFELTEDKTYYDFVNFKQPKDFYIADEEWKKISSDAECKEYVEKKIKALLAKSGIVAPISFVEHHLSHAASAYYSSGKSDALAITLDGEGDGLSATVSICKAGKINRIHSEPVKNSIGYLYSEVTKYCGFRATRHEGKITGLAAHGDINRSKANFEREVLCKNGHLYFRKKTFPFTISEFIKIKLKLIRDGNHWRRILLELGEISHKDIAAGAQYILEKRVSEFVSYWVDKTGIQDVVTAGGVFANVKLNQKIAELPNIKSFFVHPDMGDGGNAYGAAAYEYFKDHTYNPARIKDVYLGPEFSNSEIEKILSSYPELTFEKSTNIAKDTARLIANNVIIGWFQGRMEYGPRALGNRSIVASPVDATINKWLNERMKRTEFMPFAPSALYESADEAFEIGKNTSKFPAEFMTITFDMKKSWAKKAPAVAHIDGTARPQLVRKESNPKYHALISEYKKLTGIPLVINTSYNVHEEPIVCRPEEAIKSLVSGVVDALAIGDYLAKKK